MALFEDFGNIDTGNPYLNFISGFDTTVDSTKTNVSALPQATEAVNAAVAEMEERKRKKREAEKKKAMQEARKQPRFVVATKRDPSSVGYSSLPSTSPLAPYQGLGKNPNTQIKQNEGYRGLGKNPNTQIKQ